MAGANLAFSKVVATPTELAWSQAYSAGSLFATISLQTTTSPTSDSENLGSIGKDLISTLESEFFTLETKDLESIKLAITTTFARIHENISQSFVICYLNENILYLYASGEGKAVLKRGEKIGTVLEGESGNSIKSASGYVQPRDIIILQTKQFIRIISASTLASSLDKNIPSEITEELAPHIHEKAEGGASAIVLSYSESVVSQEEAAAVASVAATSIDSQVHEGLQKMNEDAEETPENPVSEVNEKLNQSMNENEINTNPNKPVLPPTSPSPSQAEDISGIVKSEPTASSDRPIENPAPKNLGLDNDLTSPYATPQKSKRKLGIGGLRKLPRSRKIILIVGILLFTIIIIASLFAVMNQKNSNNEELFNGIYNEARAKFEEGQSLKDLNASLAQENFQQAQQILEKNKDTFPEGSSEDDQIEALLEQVNSQLSGSSSGSSSNSTSSATEVDKSESKVLSAQIDNPNGTYFTQNEDFIYFLDSKGVNKIDKGNNEKELAIDKDWETAGGIGVFGSNIYVLDKTENIFKFVPTGSDFAKSNYLTGSPDLKDSAAMGIDGSIYVLNTDGTVDKYTKGSKVDFSITGLEKPLSSPTRIVSYEDDTNLYILDKGNSRIVVLDKDGKFVKAYSSDIIKSAKDIDPQEANKAIFVLASDKIYKIAMN